MEILLKKFNDKYYVWKSATWKNGTYCLCVQDEFSDEVFEYEAEQENILAIRDDPRIGYVVCQNCGELIENTLESIEAHYAERENSKNCSMCPHVVSGRDKKIINSVFEKNVDGTYNVTQTYVSTLACKTGYWSYSLESAEADEYCIHKQCRRKGVAVIDDVFVKYPGLFESLLTVDALIANKCEKEEYRRGFFEYDLKCRGTLKACVNEMGVVNHFRLIYRGSSYRLYYSDKYDILVEGKYSGYRLDISSAISNTKLEQVKKKIAGLYKEAKKNEQE